MSVNLRGKKSEATSRVSLESLWKSVTPNLCLMSTLHHFCSWRNLPRKYKFLNSVILSLLTFFLETRYFRLPNTDYIVGWEISKAHEFSKCKIFLFFCPHLYNCLFLAFSDHFSKCNSSRQDTLTVTCNRKHKVNHRWKWFITITQVSDREQAWVGGSKFEEDFMLWKKRTKLPNWTFSIFLPFLGIKQSNPSAVKVPCHWQQLPAAPGYHILFVLFIHLTDTYPGL